ncbi:MAG TPA: hypothetical protein VMW52_11050 [Phycisphaerae bacterium]|nr:hypothetical protein [Phycisphaerae bacterium]
MVKIIDRLPLCATCRHFSHEEYTIEACLAFPDGIPRAILTWKADHRKPIEGDHGISYDLSDDDQPAG